MLAKWCRPFPGLPQQVAEARYFVAALMEAEGPRMVENAVLIVSELASNAVRHSRSGRKGGWFLVIVVLDDDRVRIEVTDEGATIDRNCSLPMTGRRRVGAGCC